MAGSKANPTSARKRVEAETVKRARDGSAFTRCEACNKDVPVVLIDMHSCSLDSKIRMSLESQVVEKAAEAKKPEKKRSSPSSKKAKIAKKTKKSSDSNKRKRPPTAFFVFMDAFRKEYKEAHPDNKSVATVAKEGGEKWKSLTEEEKKPYIDKAAQLKAEYEKAVEEDNKEAENEGEDANGEDNEEEEKEAAEKEEEKDASGKEKERED
ncbi:hypothetical protein LUZ60_012066 [Juncus effusus]|nr:hypothetical protein LUZ60_012066 [Juncus effusus]